MIPYWELRGQNHLAFWIRLTSHESKAFDAWCTAEDAEQHPLDPPITPLGENRGSSLGDRCWSLLARSAKLVMSTSD